MAEEHVRGRMLLEENPGNRNPALPPQFDTTGKGDYRKVTPENPLPTASYVMSESGLWIPEPEVRDTQLSGSIVELRGYDDDKITIEAEASKEITFDIQGCKQWSFFVGQSDWSYNPTVLEFKEIRIKNKGSEEVTIASEDNLEDIEDVSIIRSVDNSKRSLLIFNIPAFGNGDHTIKIENTDSS